MRVKTVFLLIAIPYSVVSAGLPSDSQVLTDCSFPGRAEGCPDPSGQWLVQWREPTSNQGHQLALKHLASGRLVKLLEFNRSVDVSWAPDGRALALTDHAGSSDSILWVVTGPRFERLVNVEEKLAASLGKLPEIYNNGHRYFEAVRWLGADTLVFSIRAYDSEPAKEYRATFRYELGGRVTRNTEQ